MKREQDLSGDYETELADSSELTALQATFRIPKFGIQTQTEAFLAKDYHKFLKEPVFLEGEEFTL